MIDNYTVRSTASNLLWVTDKTTKEDKVIQTFPIATAEEKHRFYEQSLLSVVLKSVPTAYVGKRSFFEHGTGYLVFDDHDQITLKTKLSEDEFKPIFSQIAGTLRKIHSKRVAHRDIRPQNILFTKKSGVFIRGFENAGFWGDSRTLTGVYGRKAYIAPEMFSQKTYNGELSDAWSMGVLLYEVLTGTLPFADYTRSQILKGEAQLKLDGLSAQCQDLLKSTLEIKPNDRFRVNQILLHPWLYFNEIPPRSRTSSASSITPISSKAESRVPRRSSAPAANAHNGRIFRWHVR